MILILDILDLEMEEKIYRQIFFTSTINEENINFAEIGIKYSKLMKIAVRIMMRKTERDSDEDEEYLIRKNNEDKIEHVGSSKDKKKGIGAEENKSDKKVKKVLMESIFK